MFTHTSKNTTKLAAAAVMAFGAILAPGVASAQGEYYIKYNSHTYYVWGDRATCNAEWASTGKTCVSWGKPKCNGRYEMWSIPSTRDVASSKFDRDKWLRINRTSSGTELCIIK